MKKEIRAVIWDMGGVLVRTEDQSPRKRLAERLGIQPEELYEVVFNSESAMRATLGEIPAEEHWDFVRREFSLGVDEILRFAEQFWSGDSLDTSLIDFIQSLRPVYVTALLSNAWSDARPEMTRRFSLLDAFDYSVFSAEVGLAKPEPGIYLHLLRRMSIDPDQSVFVDDVMENVDTARSLGMHGVQFQHRDQVLRELAALQIAARSV